MIDLVHSLYLASSSPRRKDLLEQYNLDFNILIPDIDESPLKEEKATDYVVRLSCEKAACVASSISSGLVLAADTTVALREKILGKPADLVDAKTMLKQLSGSMHWVYTGYTLLDIEKEHSVSKYCATKVIFKELSEELVEAYVHTGEPLGKAGSYSIQGKGGLLVERIEGSFNNVVGLPVEDVLWTMVQQTWADWKIKEMA